MDDEKKITRADFFSILGGIAVTAILLKVASTKETLTTITENKKGKNGLLSTTLPKPDYGSGVYGGNKHG